MLCVPVIGPSLLEASQQAIEGATQGNILEFRLDRFHKHTLMHLKQLREKITLPIIFTLRPKGSASEEERLLTIKQLARLHPTYFDLEYEISHAFVQEMKKTFPKLKLILSYHNFTKTPSNLDAILQSMQKTSADLYKIACQANSTIDSLRMLDLVRKYAPILGMCIGDKGTITRILGPMMGSPWTYASLHPHQKTAEGQLSIKEHLSIYRTSRLTSTTSIYGLIGDPVTQSPSQFTHNKTMQDLNLNSVYIKMTLKSEELSSFFSLAKQIGIKGISVTMPLKEKVIPYLDSIEASAEKIGAVNTLLFQQGKLIGYNTDGKGALDAIENKIKVYGKKVVILGAGGAARAILYEALQRGADVRILSRREEKAIDLGQTFGTHNGSLKSLTDKDTYDIIINTTPHPCPILPNAIQPNALVMDLKTLPKITPFLKEAAAKKCTLIFGYEMFINQALSQFEIWFPQHFNAIQARQSMLQATVLKPQTETNA